MLNKDSLKTFFLFPQKLIFEDIVETLVAEQHEAFVINNHVEFKDALRIFHKNTLAFINIDSVLSKEEWIEYVRSLREDPLFSKIKIGILSFNPDKGLIDIYKNGLNIECGYHILSSRNKQYKFNIVEIIKELQAKEKQKILRLYFDGSDPVNFMIKDNSQILRGKIDALSSAAMSITLENDKLLKKGMDLNNIQISYLENNCKLMGTVIGNSQTNKNQFLIKFNTLFNDIHKKPLFKIIHQVLDKKMKELVQ